MSDFTVFSSSSASDSSDSGKTFVVEKRKQDHTDTTLTLKRTKGAYYLEKASEYCENLEKRIKELERKLDEKAEEVQFLKNQLSMASTEKTSLTDTIELVDSLTLMDGTQLSSFNPPFHSTPIDSNDKATTRVRPNDEDDAKLLNYVAWRLENSGWKTDGIGGDKFFEPLHLIEKKRTATGWRLRFRKICENFDTCHLPDDIKRKLQAALKLDL